MYTTFIVYKTEIDFKWYLWSGNFSIFSKVSLSLSVPLSKKKLEIPSKNGKAMLANEVSNNLYSE